MNDEEIKLRFDYVQRDVGELKTAVQALTATIQMLKPVKNWPNILTMFIVVTPLYALVADLIARGFK